MTAALWIALSLGAQGCADSDSGWVAGPGDTPNFEVTNYHYENVHLYVDGGSIGDVAAGATEAFAVRPGFRRLELRESGSNVYEWQGDYDFSASSILTFSYDPDVSENLSVTNNDAFDDVDIYVDGHNIGTVRDGETRTWLIVSGRYVVHAREEGDVDAELIGEFNFNTSELVDLTYQ